MLILLLRDTDLASNECLITSIKLTIAMKEKIDQLRFGNHQAELGGGEDQNTQNAQWQADRP